MVHTIAFTLNLRINMYVIVSHTQWQDININTYSVWTICADSMEREGGREKEIERKKEREKEREIYDMLSTLARANAALSQLFGRVRQTHGRLARAFSL